MKRATTPRYEFQLPFSADYVDELRLVYVQKKKIVLKKSGDQLIHEGNSWVHQFTQEEANKFSSGSAQAQIRVRTVDGEVMASDILDFYVESVLDDEVLT